MKEQWIKDAHAGGYDKRKTRLLEKMLWDIEAWKAVGTTRGWYTVRHDGVVLHNWGGRMNTFMFRIQRGSSIEEALGVIS